MSSPGVRVLQSLLLCLLLFVSLSFISWLLRCHLYFCVKHLLITPMVTPHFSYLFRKIYILKLTNQFIKHNIIMISEYVYLYANLPMCVLLFLRLLILSLIYTHCTQWWIVLAYLVLTWWIPNMWHRYSVAINQVTVAIVKRLKWWPQLNHM